MMYTNKNIKLWFATPDAPAPTGKIPAGVDLSITAGVAPVHPDNTVYITYQINSEDKIRDRAAFLQNLSDPDKQYFRFDFPPLKVGDVVKYKVCFFCTGQQFPPIESSNESEVSFQVAASNLSLYKDNRFVGESVKQPSLNYIREGVLKTQASNSKRSAEKKSPQVLHHKASKCRDASFASVAHSPTTTPNATSYKAYRIEASLPKSYALLNDGIEQQLWADNTIQVGVDMSTNTQNLVEISLLDGQKIKYIRKNVSNSSRIHFKTWVEDELGHRLSPEDIPIALLPLYNIHGIDKNSTSYQNFLKPVIVCQGKPATDALINRGYLAVGTLCGALRTPSETALLPLANRPVILWPNNSDVGIKHMQRIAEKLNRLGNTAIQVLLWKGTKKNANALHFNGNNSQLQELLANSISWPADSVTTDYGVVDFSFPKTSLRMSLNQKKANGYERLVKPSFWKQNRKLRLIAKNIMPILEKINADESISPKERLLLNHQLGLLEATFGKKFVNQLITNANNEEI